MIKAPPCPQNVRFAPFPYVRFAPAPRLGSPMSRVVDHDVPRLRAHDPVQAQATGKTIMNSSRPTHSVVPGAEPSLFLWLFFDAMVQGLQFSQPRCLVLDHGPWIFNSAC